MSLIRNLLVAAHRAQDWENAKVLSQENERLKRIEAKKAYCQWPECGLRLRKVSKFCYRHFIMNRYYQKALKTVATIIVGGALASVAQPAVFLQPTNPAPVVQLAWNPSPSQNVTNYFLYQGVGSFQYTNKMSLGNAVATQFTLPTRGVTYFFAVTAQDNHGLESVFSNEVNYTPSAPPASPSMKPLVVLVAQQAPSVSGPFVDTGFNWSADPSQSPATVYRLAIAKGMQLAVVPPPMPSK